MKLTSNTTAEAVAARVTESRATQRGLLRFLDDVRAEYGTYVSAGHRALAESALTSEKTARKYLRLAVEGGFIAVVQDGNASAGMDDRRTTKYTFVHDWTGWTMPRPVLSKRNEMLARLTDSTQEIQGLAKLSHVHASMHDVAETRPIPF